MARLIAKYEPAPRQWYQSPAVVYGISIPKVQARLEWLMGTHIVQALDRGYQTMLQKMMEEDFSQTIENRNYDRQKAEIDREKQLVLEGKMALDEAPQGVSENPVIKINEKIEEIQHRDEKKKKTTQSPVYNYDYKVVKALLNLRGERAPAYGDTTCEISDCYKLPQNRYEEIYTEEYAETYLVTPEIFTRFRPQEIDIAELNEFKNIHDLYRAADELLGIQRESFVPTLERIKFNRSKSENLGEDEEEDEEEEEDYDEENEEYNMFDETEEENN